MKGILIRNDNSLSWFVKWSDLHSFGHGTHWMYTELSPDSNSIRYIKDNQIMDKPLEEGLDVEFEMVTTGYDEVNYSPLNSAKLIFPEVDVFEKEEYIKEYLKNGGELFLIDSVSVFRDGGTIVLHKYGILGKPPIYINKDFWTIHNGYPTTDENLITDKAEQIYILDRLERYKKDCQYNLEQAKRVIEKIKL